MKRYISIDLSAMRKLGITPTGWVLLEYLHNLTDAEDSICVNLPEARDYLGLQKNKDVTLLLNSLINRGLVSEITLDGEVRHRTTTQWAGIIEDGIYIPANLKDKTTKQHSQRAQSASREVVVAPPLVSSNTTEVVVSKLKTLNKTELDELSLECDRIVTYFIQERQKIQPDYDLTTTTFGGKFPRYEPRYAFYQHILESSRTPKHYADMIRWLFNSPSKEALFWKNNIMTIDGLIKNYDRVELASMGNEEDSNLQSSIQNRITLMRAAGEPEDKIVLEIEKMRKK